MNRFLFALTAPLLFAACAHGGKAEPEPRITAEPANARVRLYADCVGSAARAGGLQRYGRYILYTCQGAPAQALFEASETHVRSRGFETTSGTRITRSFSDRDWDDRCWSDTTTTGVTYACSLTQPVGSFLDPARDILPPAPQRR